MGLYSFSNDPELFAGLDVKNPSWFGWNTLMKVYDGIKLDKAEAKFFGSVTGGLSQPFGKNIPRRWCIIAGAGAGKSRFLSRVIPYRSILEFDSYLKVKKLHPGQVAENIIVAPNIDSAKITFNYVEDTIKESPPLFGELIPERPDSPASKLIVKNTHVARMKFANGSQVSVQGVARVTGRGRSIWTLFIDEGAFFKVSGRFSDEEVYNSAVPRLGRFGLWAMVFMVTTPWDKSGLVWKTYRDHFGKANQPWLVIQGATPTFNPTVDPAFLKVEEERDPERYRREVLAQFVDSVYGAFSAEAVEAVTAYGRRALPYNPGYKYFAFIDAATLSQSQTAKFNDEFCSGIACIIGGKVVIVWKRAWKATTDGKRVTPDEAVAQTIEALRRYRVKDVMGDRVGAGYIEHKFTDKKEFKFINCPLSKSDLYLYAIPMVNDGSVELLDDDMGLRQLKALERKRGDHQRDHIDHPKDGHDDRANVDCGLIYMGRERMWKHAHSPSDIRAGKPSLAEMSRAADELAGMM